MSKSFNDLIDQDRANAIELAKECVGKEEYSKKVSELGVSGAEKWAFEEAKANNFNKIEFTRKSKSSDHSNNTHKSNEQVKRTNEDVKEKNKTKK